MHTPRTNRRILGAGAVVALVVAAFAVAAMPVAHAVDTPLTIDVTSMDFGQVNVGNTSPDLTVTVTNGGATPFGPINMFGGAPFDPSFGASQNCQGATLAPGGSCQIVYTFSPTTPGAASSSSNFVISDTADQADGEDFAVTLAGTGVNPITVTPSSHDFGTVAIGTTSPDAVTVVTNTSATPFGPINMFGGAPFDPSFGASQNCQGATLAPGGSCQIVYTFSPTTPGAASSSSNFVISATAQQSAGADFSVALAGCGGDPACPEADVAATKTVGGDRLEGGTVTYTIVGTNSGDAASADNTGPELTDVLPASLTLVSATATSGTVVATPGTNTVTWDGALAPGAAVTITITAAVKGGTVGTSVSNQGTWSFDADGDGTNETSVLTDDPSVVGAANATVFTVAAAPVTPVSGVTPVTPVADVTPVATPAPATAVTATPTFTG